MKLIIALAFVVSMLMASSFVLAAPGNGRGTQGTISAVGSAGFAMTTSDGKTIDVLCNSTTKFRSGGQDAGPSAIKTGIKVSVQGGTSGPNQMTASVVNIIPAKN